jgi:CheY-like chemotaxis protein
MSAAPKAAPQPSVQPRAVTESDRRWGVSLKGVKVLMVDDEADTRTLVKRVLEDCHATVVTAASAMEALSLLPSQRPNVLVCDIGMPAMDGYELIRRVRALEKSTGESVPAIAFMAFARAEDRTRAINAGFREYISKPVEPGELVKLVGSLARKEKQ